VIVNIVGYLIALMVLEGHEHLQCELKKLKIYQKQRWPRLRYPRPYWEFKSLRLYIWISKEGDWGNRRKQDWVGWMIAHNVWDCTMFGTDWQHYCSTNFLYTSSGAHSSANYVTHHASDEPITEILYWNVSKGVPIILLITNREYGWTSVL